MSNLDPRIEAVRARYDLSKDDFWQIPQNKQWVCKHAALEIVATKANVEWSAPQIIEAHTAEGIAVMAVTGRMGDRVEWATGEASPKNNKNSYPWAMAEKRAKDRVILKLVGIHGLVYSEDEMPTEEPRTTDQRSEQGRREVARQQEQLHANVADESQSVTKRDARPIYQALVKDMRKCTTRDDLKRWMNDEEVIALRAKLPPDWDANLRNEAKEQWNSLTPPEPAPATANGASYRAAKDGKPSAADLVGAG